jgi:hypothetical protein
MANPLPEKQIRDADEARSDSPVEEPLLKDHFVHALGQLERLHR